MTPANPDPSTIVVACATDRRYPLPLAVMLASVGAHLAPGVQIEAYVLDDGVPDEDKRRIVGSLPGNVHLEWRRSTTALEGLPIWGRMSTTTYQKLTLDEWLPAGAGRALWLDCDLLALDDLSPLWRCSMGDNIIMAAQDQRVQLVSLRFGVAAWRELGLPADARYFNAGVLLIDRERWRRHDVSRRCLDYLRVHARRLYFWDQEAMNAVLAGRWGKLDPRWNRHPCLDHLAGPEDMGRGRSSDPPASREPAILHFSGNLKPWRFAGNGRCCSLYRSYLDRTAWAGWRPEPRWHDSLLSWYESSRLRRLIHPAEQLATIALRNLTRRRSDAKPGVAQHG
jgi:lipopolysaccharide biosynthesis glycosyltransferase